jgi:hypothetical protein
MERGECREHHDPASDQQGGTEPAPIGGSGRLRDDRSHAEADETGEDDDFRGGRNREGDGARARSARGLLLYNPK